MQSDFTNPDRFLSYLSDFWTQVFTDREAVRGLLAGDALHLRQLQRDFEELVRSVSIDGVEPLHEEELYPIFIRRSTLSTGPGKLLYGQGEVYGTQPQDGTFAAGQTFLYGQDDRLSPRWYHALPPDVRSLGGVLVDRPFGPHVVFVEGVDYALQQTSGGPIVVFRDNPFINPSLVSGTVSDGEVPDQEICLFAPRAKLDHGGVHERFGYPFFAAPPAGITAGNYRTLLGTIMRLYSDGSTVAALDAFFAAACGVPLTNDDETVESVTALVDGSQVVVTDARVYSVAAGLTLRNTVEVGATLPADSPLTTATVVWDGRTAPRAIFAQGGLHAGADFLPPDIGMQAGLGFRNEDVPVDPGEPLAVTVDGAATVRRSGSFALVGAPADVAEFWQAVRARGTSEEVFFADRLWRARDAVDEASEPNYALPVFINPLEFLYDNFLRDGLIGITLSVAPTAVLLASLRHLRETLPAARTLLLFVAPRSSEDVTFTVDASAGTGLVLAAPADERAVLTGGAVPTFDANAALSIVSAVGSSESCGLLAGALDFGDPSVVNSTVRFISFPAC